LGYKTTLVFNLLPTIFLVLLPILNIIFQSFARSKLLALCHQKK